jgi:hypothetical protein
VLWTLVLEESAQGLRHVVQVKRTLQEGHDYYLVATGSLTRAQVLDQKVCAHFTSIILVEMVNWGFQVHVQTHVVTETLVHVRDICKSKKLKK